MPRAASRTAPRRARPPEPAVPAYPGGAALAAAIAPPGRDQIDLRWDDRSLRLTNLTKTFWPEPGLTKGDLLRYYIRIAPALLPHIEGRPTVMKRYPDGAAGGFFFMKHAPPDRPDYIRICSIEHASGSVIDFAIVDDLVSLLWVVNLGCIDLNPWYARCDDVHRPDDLHFDLDPTPGAAFAQICEGALALREALEGIGMPAFVKTTGSRGLHVYVPIERGPTQKQVWAAAKAISVTIAARRRDLFTAVYRVADRPRARVLIDYNQNAWGRTLASIYSVRPTPAASVSTPVTWEEVREGFAIEDHRLDTVPERVERLGDLWAPLLDPERRVQLGVEGAGA